MAKGAAAKSGSSGTSVFDYEYLSPEQIRGYDNYKYSSVDTSPVAIYVSHPFWDQVVKIYPRWLAPNILTFSGCVLVMASYAISCWLDWDMLGSSDNRPEFPPLPNWLWLLFGLANFAAHVLDGTDGKQARRTGASGPTGELFDHGIDSWLTLPFTLTMFSIFGRDDYSVSAVQQLAILMSVQLVFVISHWEKYNTGILFLPWGYDISQYALSIMYVITFIGGYKMWKFYIAGIIAPAQVAEIAFYVACFGMSIPMSLANIHKAHKAGTLKHSSFLEAFRPLFSTGVLFAVGLGWALGSPHAVLEVDFRSFTWVMGAAFSNIACRLIVAQMTNTRCEAWNWLLCPLLALALASVSGALSAGAELVALRVLALAVTAAHLHYGICVVRQMCRHFGIHCFSLAYLREREAAKTQ